MTAANKHNRAANSNPCEQAMASYPACGYDLAKALNWMASLKIIAQIGNSDALADTGSMKIDPSAAPHFDSAFRARLHDLFCWRRDVRRFRSDPLPPGLLERLIEIACQAPSVGLSQPWRFVVVDDHDRRQRVIENFESCNAAARNDYTGDLSTRYAALKLAGLREAPCHLAVFADRSTATGHGLGRRTMPEMADYSVVTAIFSIWLAARAEGVGVGWVSILDPAMMAGILDVPSTWHFIGYFCLGYPQAEDDSPELERVGWEERQPASNFVFRR